MDFRKNLLDLNYHKYLFYKNTTIIILFSYFIAVFIPFLIGELILSNFLDMLLVGSVTSILLASSTVLIIEFNYHLKKIPEELKKL